MINLSKGGRVNLSKEAPGTQKFHIDLDVSVFLCKYDAQNNPKLISDQHFVFYNSEVRTTDRKETFIQPSDDFPKRGMPASKCLGVVHSGDNRTGSGDGDDEVIFLDVSKLAADIEEISVVVTIDQAEARRQNFGQVRNSYIQISDEVSGAVIAKYLLEEDFSLETSVQVGSFYRRDGNFMFKAVGAGYNRGLGDFVRAYGGTV